MLNSIQFYLLIFFTFFICLASTGQTTYTVSGIVLDEKNDEPVPYAQVAILSLPDSIAISGGVTEPDGSFSIGVEPGNYVLQIAFLGYEEKYVPNLRVNKDINLGEVLIGSDSELLDEVVITGEVERRPIEADIEGIQIRPDQTISNAGGSVLDILRNTPSIDISDDGTVSLRGSNGTNVLIDGRNSALATDLEQIPASAIESIKIINNPNSKYDAQAAGGVINIKLKKAEGQGTTASAEITTGTRYRFNGNVRVSHRAKNFNVFGGYSYRSWPSVGNSYTEREIFAENELLQQTSERRSTGDEHTINIGADYFFGKNKISYEGATNFEIEEDRDRLRSRLFDTETGNDILSYVRNNQENEENYTFDNALVYERLFSGEDTLKEFRVVVSHSLRDQLENQDISVYNNTLSIKEIADGKQRAETDEIRTNIVAQMDYVQSLWGGKFEAGYKTQFRSFDNDYRYEVRNEETGQFYNQDSISNRFLYEENVHAAYLIATRSFGKFNMSIGTRAEYTNINTRLYDTDETSNQEYANLFPSAQLSYNITKDNTLKFTYSRRIDRPNSWRLNPFPDVTDSLNIRRGNPNLKPEYINSFELGQLINFEKTTLVYNFFYRQTIGMLDYLVTVEDGISYRQPQNLNSGQTYGLEVINTATIAEWWSINASVSIFRSEVDGANVDAGYTNSGFGWNTKVTTDFDLPFAVDLQLTGNYTSPEIEAQGRDFARYYVDASLQRRFLEGKATVSLIARDLFNIRNFSGYNETDEFRQEFTHKRESQIFLLSLSFKL